METHPKPVRGTWLAGAFWPSLIMTLTMQVNPRTFSRLNMADENKKLSGFSTNSSSYSAKNKFLLQE